MAQLSETAQNTMDLYYQQYKSDEDFFQFYHFQYLNSVVYGKILQEEYEKSYKLSLAERGIGEATMNPEWYVPAELDVVPSEEGDREVVLPSCPFTFRFDRSSTGIQNISQLAGRCGEFIRISAEETWKLKSAPNTDIIWWYPLGNKIIFPKIHCGLKKVRVLYIPSLKELDDNCAIPDSMAHDIIAGTLNLMFIARSGGVVDMTSNQNPNKVMETELDTTFKNLKTNP